MLRIYNFVPTGRGLRVAWLCEEMAVPYVLVSVACPPPPEYRQVNALGTVPFLEDRDGVAINESIAMLLYIARRYGPTRLLPDADIAAFARVLQMTEFGEATLGAGLNPLVGARYMAPAADKRNWSVRSLEMRAQRFLDFVEAALGERSFVAGDAFSLADISVSFSLGMWVKLLGKQLSARLDGYYRDMTARAAYRAASSRVAVPFVAASAVPAAALPQ